jgi:SAM-dependent methyltransferase
MTAGRWRSGSHRRTERQSRAAAAQLRLGRGRLRRGAALLSGAVVRRPRRLRAAPTRCQVARDRLRNGQGDSSDARAWLFGRLRGAGSSPRRARPPESGRASARDPCGPVRGLGRRARGFDLIYAATAWRWLDPAIRYHKAHRLLRSGGHLAFWSAQHAFPAGFDPFFTEIQEVYNAIGEGWTGRWPPPPPDQVVDDSAEIEASGFFDDIRVRRYVWETLYTADEYIALLNTFSGHITMETAKRAHLYREIRRRIGRRPDPRVRRHWLAILHVARRIKP